MKRSVKPMTTVAAYCLAVCISVQGGPPPGAAADPHFWDEIPVSPSTTMPRTIRDDYWHGQFQRVNREVARADGVELVFFGDSITWHWSLGRGVGRMVWEGAFAGYRPINMGNSGDITPVMLYRVTHGNLDFAEGQQPKVAVLLCGTNNFGVNQSDGGRVRWDLGPHCPPEDVAAGVRAVAQVFRRRLPRTRVIMLGILPVSNPAKWARCRQVNALHAALACDRNEVVFLDLQDRFLGSDGSIEGRLFTDGTHLTGEGYRVWAESIGPLVEEMMQAEPLDPVEIMLIGDSITEGASSSASYRRYLDGMLRRKGHLIDFVGSRAKHLDDQVLPGSYAFDVDHEGHWKKNSAWLARHMPRLLAGREPDVAVIHTGSEDLVSSTSAAEPLTGHIIENIDSVIAALRARKPGVKIVLAQVIPVRGKAGAVQLLNRKIAHLAEARSTRPSPVVAADLHTGFDAAHDLAADGLLPSESGARNMATALAGAIDGLLNQKVP